MLPFIGALALSFLIASAPAANASVLWTGDPTDGTSAFGNIECEAPGVLDVEADAFRFQKSVGTYRCEARGVSVDDQRVVFAANQTYWLGWTQAFELVPDSTQGDWVPWQWKSYPNADQNYPLLMRVQDGQIKLTYVAPGGAWSTIWSTPVEAFTPNAVAIGIHTSSQASAGWFELYYNGQQQTFLDGSSRYHGRTWDSANEPKWGAYDRDNTSFQIANRVSNLSIGTTKEDVL
ncbi:hypothetical protein [Pseudoclavibacter sp. VKM Ac-2867]|uniref:hypothetical protein n=1 Tax=Pseudoclavibacter sp. VKM Ac-2867 TaxID=2783829 RepID=UPI00188C454B|nr:hypothetical protein [Pseudoclavibacter sp. VKM Ac-2867]MBF4459397.1 hypothetical protein [Pseudoclavibacter sp. VKM Ac-2867]